MPRPDVRRSGHTYEPNDALNSYVNRKTRPSFLRSPSCRAHLIRPVLPLLVIEEHRFPQLQFFGAVRTGGVSQKAVPQENVARVAPTIGHGDRC